MRRLELADAEMMFCNWTSDDKVTRFLRWDAHKLIDDTKNMIQQWVNNYQHDSTYYWGMYLKDGFHDCSLYGIVRNEWKQKYSGLC